jgi:hypothetical protein
MARSGERALVFDQDLLVRMFASRRMVPAPSQNQTSICGLELRRAVTED